MPEEAKQIRETAKEDLFFFARLVNPGYIYGDIHKQLYQWMQTYTLYGRGDDITSNKLIMLPRAHLKSHMVATWCAWIITRHPEVTILYVSATAELAETQFLQSRIFLALQFINAISLNTLILKKGLEKVGVSVKISIDHPIRKKEGIRDSTVATAGLTTNTTGWHADIVVADDLVVPENAYTEDGREAVSKKASQFTSVRNAGGFTLACGTRYHPSDIYATWRAQEYELFNDDGDVIDKKPVWEIMEYAVEDNGVYLWPGAIRSDGKAFGFDNRVLSRI